LLLLEKSSSVNAFAVLFVSLEISSCVVTVSRQGAGEDVSFQLLKVTASDENTPNTCLVKYPIICTRVSRVSHQT
jgi:predicted small secreted protein